jgi:tetratricopeptide (TPR) repeat protein
MPSWLRWLREAIALVADIWGVITCIAAVGGAVGWLMYVRLGEEYLPAITIGVLGIMGTAVCAYLAFKRKPAPPLGMGQAPAYPRARRFALAGLVLIPLLTVGNLAGWWYWRSLPPQKIIILVADFHRESTNQDDYIFTRPLLQQLQNALAGDTKVEVQALGRAITAQEGSTGARQEGERHKAAIVIWGWYGVPPGGSTAVVSAHFEVLRQPKYMPSMEAEGTHLVALALLESFAFQTQLSREMVYLTAFTVGMGRYAATEWEGAIRNFTTALAQTDEPVQALDRSVVYFCRGTVYDLQADYERAISDFDQAIALKPDLHAAYGNRGNAYARLGQYQRAIADYDRVIALKPDDAMAYNNRGLAYGNLGQYQRAITDFDRAIALQPNFAEAHYNRGLAYGNLGQYQRAIADFDRAITLKPDDAMAYNNRGLAYGNLGQYQRAITDFDRAIALKPDYTMAYNNRGHAYADLGQYPRAIADFDRAIALKPDYAAAYVNRGNAYAKQSQYQQAIAEYDQAIALQPNFAEAYANLGVAYGNLGQYQRAIADFDQAIALKPDDARVYNNRGLAYKLLGEKAKAAADFRKVLELSQDAALQEQAEKELKGLE